MTSVVDTSVKIFTSQMVGAPALTGAAGSKIGVLDACLVNGFDLKSATSLVVAGGVATLSFAGLHSAIVDSVVLVEGSSIAALNGEQKVTAIGAGVVRFATAEANATATGTITFKMAPAGWVKEFAGTNVAAYRSANVLGTRMYLRIDDTSTTLCRVVGYETMTDINTGTGPFPTAAQMAGGGYWPKAQVAGSTPLLWCLIADTRTLIDTVGPSYHLGATYNLTFSRVFGDIAHVRPAGDPYACVLGYSVTNSVQSMNDAVLAGGVALQYAIPRSYTGLGSAVLHASAPYTGDTSACSGRDPKVGDFPSPADGGLKLSRKFVSPAVSSSYVRGDIVGWYHAPQQYVWDSIKMFDTVTVGGRKLMSVGGTVTSSTSVASSTTAGAGFVDITGPWW